MMAAVLRLRPLGAQMLRGPPWPWRSRLGHKSLLIRGLGSGGGQAVGLSPPSVGPSPPCPPAHPPSMGPDSPPMGLDSPPMGPDSPPMGPDLSAMGPALPPCPPSVGPVLLEDVGLGAPTPVGLIQNFLQFLHLDVGLPWWGAIATGTLCARVLLLPLLIRGQREAARLALHLPHLQLLSQRLQHARAHGDQLQVARAYSELVAYQKKHDVNPLRGFLVPLVQTPLFVSFFLALRAMAAAPLPGLRSGGWGWVPDLTAPDPLYVLPLLVTASTWAVMEAGAEAGVATPGAGPTRQLLRLLPLLFLPFILHFPTAVLTYWLTSNAFSLLQTALLRVPALRAGLRIAPPPAAPPPAGPAPRARPARRGILERLKEEWATAQAAKRGEERERQRRKRLEMAGKGPLRQTFSQNPLGPPPLPPRPPPPPKRPWKETLGP
ncbi:mitochondrial inner membrane protein OXA1L isoform X2 [Patagioenas fasciata]|uniref:mitochondrial inner membrane protein OXA1L isoform X2 n=1 Tax=Patagioenas fasciata TaxID=372321 RepID=UPI003A99736F